MYLFNSCWNLGNQILKLTQFDLFVVICKITMTSIKRTIKFSEKQGVHLWALSQVLS